MSRPRSFAEHYLVSDLTASLVLHVDTPAGDGTQVENNTRPDTNTGIVVRNFRGHNLLEG